MNLEHRSNTKGVKQINEKLAMSEILLYFI